MVTLTLNELHLTNGLIRDLIADWYNGCPDPYFKVHEAIRTNNPGWYVDVIIETIAKYWHISIQSVGVRKWVRFQRIIRNTIQQIEAEYLGL